MEGRKISKLFEKIRFRDRMGLIYCIREFESVNFIEITTESTPLVYAIDRGWVEGVRILIQAGANVNFSNNPESNPLVSAIHIYSTAILEILLDAGANVDGLGFLGTPLIEAIRYDNSSCIARLIEAEANLNQVDTSGTTPLMAAVLHNDFDLVKKLVERGADVNYQNYFNRITALEVAANNGHQEVFEYLFPMTTCEENRKYALQKLSRGIIRKQRREDTLTYDFIIAAAIGDVGGIRQGIDAGVDIDAFGEYGETALHKASENGHLDVVRLLLEAGADLERCCESDLDTLTPLYFAIQGGNSEIVKILLEADVDIHVKPYTDSNQTLLRLAIDRNNLEIAQMLIDAGIDLNAIDNGWTALDIARKRRYEPMVQLLTKAGAVGHRKIDIFPVDPDEIPF